MFFFFFNLLKDSDEPLWDGCTNHGKLSVVARVLTIKSDHELSKVSHLSRMPLIEVNH
jgi:hypothetical protein